MSKKQRKKDDCFLSQAFFKIGKTLKNSSIESAITKSESDSTGFSKGVSLIQKNFK